MLVFIAEIMFSIFLAGFGAIALVLGIITVVAWIMTIGGGVGLLACGGYWLTHRRTGFFAGNNTAIYLSNRDQLLRVMADYNTKATKFIDAKRTFRAGDSGTKYVQIRNEAQ